MLPDLPNECMSCKRATERTNGTWINVGSINYEHVWYIAKMEGIIVSAIVTAVDIASYMIY